MDFDKLTADDKTFIASGVKDALKECSFLRRWLSDGVDSSVSGKVIEIFRYVEQTYRVAQPKSFDDFLVDKSDFNSELAVMRKELSRVTKLATEQQDHIDRLTAELTRREEASEATYHELDFYRKNYSKLVKLNDEPHIRRVMRGGLSFTQQQGMPVRYS